MITVPTKDIGIEVKDKFVFRNYKWNLEEGNEDYIKKELRCEDVK